MIFHRVASGAAATTLLLMAAIFSFLLISGWDAISERGWSFFTTTTWSFTTDADGNPVNEFGVAALLWGTIVVAVIAMLFAVPLSIGTALFINEYAPRKIKSWLVGLVDLLAAIPSLIFGMWGLLVFMPKMFGTQRWIADHLGFVPFFSLEANEQPNFNNSALVAGMVVALMVMPITTSVIREVFDQAPAGEKEAALALGSTKWGMIRAVVLPFGQGGIVGGSMLGLGRALGETIALALLLQSSFQVSYRVLEAGQTNTVAAHIAVAFGEAAEGLELNALIAAGLALFTLTLVVNMFAQIVISRSRSGEGVEL